jgi:5-(carboxyamino)imidazole ribonucleotide mutase
MLEIKKTFTEVLPVIKRFLSITHFYLNMPDISVIMGSASDEKIAEKTTQVLDDYGVSYEVRILSAHRNPEELREYVINSDAKVFIAIAGLSAALPGVIASITSKPVIGVPVSASLLGIDALLSIIQMPSGIPVGGVGIDNGKNAAYLALRILALLDRELEQKLKEKQIE